MARLTADGTLQADEAYTAVRLKDGSMLNFWWVIVDGDHGKLFGVYANGDMFETPLTSVAEVWGFIPKEMKA